MVVSVKGDWHRPFDRANLEEGQDAYYGKDVPMDEGTLEYAMKDGKAAYEARKRRAFCGLTLVPLIEAWNEGWLAAQRAYRRAYGVRYRAKKKVEKLMEAANAGVTA